MRLFSTLVFLTACAPSKEERALCANEESARNLVPTHTVPDWESVVTYGDDGSVARTGDDQDDLDGEFVVRQHIQAWDCLDLSWWNPAEPVKVVQVWFDETECDLYERSIVEFYDCDSHEGEDDVFRDRDSDGVYMSEGDCDDTDPLTHPDGVELCDEVDNNCDGAIDEDGARDDPEALP